MSYLLQTKIEQSFKKNDKKVFFIRGKKYITYNEIEKKSKMITKWLDKCQDGSKIGILMTDNEDFFSAMIGVLNARCIFIPFMSILPERRIADMNEVVDIDYLITDEEQLYKAQNIFHHLGINEVCVLDRLEVQNCCDIKTRIFDQKDPVYIYFTSGSTGKPKAILGKNESLTQFIDWESKEFEIDDSVVASQLTSVGFDASLRDFFIPFFNGGIVCCPEDRDRVLEASEMSKWMEESKITILHCTPSIFRLLINNNFSGNEFLQLRYICLAGEEIRVSDARKWYEVFGERIRLVNFYGASETTMIRAFHIITQEDLTKERIPVGKAIDGTKLLVLNSRMKPYRRGMEGEVYIRTVYGSLGYYSDPELTKEKFIINPYTNEKDDLIYRTGDIGRILEDGNLEIIGRTDRMVKIHGTRIELNDIEIAAAQMEGIMEAAVICKEKEEIKYLELFYTSSESIKEDLVRQKLEKILPYYSIPQFIKLIDKLPLNTNGKVDYNQLQNLQFSEDKKLIEPETETEKKILNIWKEILERSDIGITDNFFGLGGHSLNVMAMVNNIRQQFQTDIQIKFVFENPTIRQISDYIEHSSEGGFEISAASTKKYYETTASQKRIYALQQFSPDSPFYIISKRLMIHGDLVLADIESTLRQLVKRHEVLRTAIVDIEGDILQYVESDIKLPLIYFEADTIEQAEYILDRQKLIFQMDQAPLFKMYVIGMPDKSYMLEFLIHHIIADGISMKILIHEFSQIHSGENLSDVTLQYKDYAEYESGNRFHEKIAQQKKYWLSEYNDGVPVLNMPTDFSRGNELNNEGKTLHYQISDEVIQKLDNLKTESGMSKYAILLSVYILVLNRYCGQEEIVVGMPVSGRTNQQIENMIGFFANTVAIKFICKPGIPYQEYLSNVWSQLTSALDNQEYPFEQLVQSLKIERLAGHNPLFDVMFSMNEINFDKLSMQGVKVRESNQCENTAKFDLTMSVINRNEKYEIIIEYATRLFRKETVERFWEHYSNILEQICMYPQIKMSDIVMITESEKRTILGDFNNTRHQFDWNQTLAGIFEEQVSRYPERIAVKYENTQLTYSELNVYANRLAHLLIRRGIQKNAAVGILAERSVWMMTAVLGVLKAGGAYVPLDNNYPDARIQYIVENSCMGLLLVQDTLKEAKNLKINQIYFGENTNIDECSERPDINNSPDDLAYIIYTSGSTGMPKGVIISNRNILNSVYGWRIEYNLNETQLRLLQLASFSFDVFTGDWCKALLNGGTMFLCSEVGRLDVDYLKSCIQQNQINYLETTPGILFGFMDYIYECKADIHSLKMVTVGSDTCNYEEFQKLYERYGKDIQIRNSYGLTESSVDGTFFTAGATVYESIGVPIGKPMANYYVCIVDNTQSLVPVGIFGELYIGGEGIAQGYCNNAELTKEKFIDSPWRELPGVFYKTGDMGRWLPDGNIEFVGRIDNQIKLNGYRIETGEIENCLLKNPNISECVVICRKNMAGQDVLCAFVVSVCEMSSEEIKKYAEKFLPGYMVPRVVVFIQKVPMTLNGKVDRKKLCEISMGEEGSVPYEAPQGEEEKLIAEIWAEALNQEKVGRNDDFMEIGGDSIKMIKVISIIRKRGYELSAKDFYENTKLSAVSMFVKKSAAVVKKDFQGILKLMPVQKEFFQNSTLDKNHWNQAVMLKMQNIYSYENLKTCIKAITENHMMLRTTFIQKEDEWYANIHGKGESPLWKLSKIEIGSKMEWKSELEKFCNYIQSSLNFESGPTMHIGVIEHLSEQYILICIHHLCVDTVSWRILFDDLNELLGQIVEVKLPNIMPEIALYSQRVQEIYDYANSDQCQQESDYWKEQMLLESDSLPVKQNNIVRKGSDRRKVVNVFSQDLTEQIRKRKRYSVQESLITVVLKALNQCFEVENIRLSMESHGRRPLLNNLDTSRTIGWFTAEYPVMFQKLNRDIEEVCDHVQQTMNLIPNDGISYGVHTTILEDFEFRKINPLVCFNYHGEFDTDIKSDYFMVLNEEAGKMVSDEFQSPYALSVQSMLIENQIQIEVVYDKKEFEEKQMKLLKQSIQECMEELLFNDTNQQKVR